MADDQPEGHLINGHQVVVQNDIAYIDGVQATLGRADVDVLNVLSLFFDHLSQESRVSSGPGKALKEPDPHRVPEVSLIEAAPGATIVINVGR